MQDEFKRIPLKDIEPDPNQPRKHFDEAALAELAHSISQYDVIEPIMVRLAKSKNGKFIIVVGERRFRAAGMAMLPDIPAIIRKLTDGEALEVQITENLQRENVNPMEEAEAFKTILDSKRYKPKELAARIGKKVEYILQRVKLCDLIPEFQELVYADKMKLTQAYLVCRFAKEVQQSYAGKIPADWKEQPTGWKLSEIYFGNATHNLDEAPFKTEDPTLNPKMGVCGHCRFNSAVSQLQFEDYGNSRVCSNPSCYEIKQAADFKNKLVEVATDDDLVFVAKYAYGPEATNKVKAAEGTGKPVLRDGQFQIMELPTPPEDFPTFELYVKENDWTEGMTEEEMREEYNDELADHQREVQSYLDELKEYEAKKPFIRKAYVVTGYQDEGKMIDVYVPGSTDGASAEDISNQEQIRQLRTKHDAAVRRDEINFMKNQKASLWNDDSYTCKDAALDHLELIAIFHLLFRQVGWKVRQDIQRYDYESQTPAQMISQFILAGKPERMFRYMRRMVLSLLTDDQSFDHDDEGLKASLLLVKSLCGRYRPKPFNEDLERYNAALQVKKNKLNEKIAALQQTEIPAEA